MFLRFIRSINLRIQKKQSPKFFSIIKNEEICFDMYEKVFIYTIYEQRSDDSIFPIHLVTRRSTRGGTTRELYNGKH